MTGSTLRTPDALISAGLAAPADRAGLEAVAARYAIAVSPAMAGLIDPADHNDPIAAQFVPDPRELVQAPGERDDPIGDAAHSPLPGLVHRYRDRVLLKPMHVCPVYCRFCFRREMVGPGSDSMDTEDLDRAIAYIAGHPEIFEVILTGGDPLMLSARRLKDLVTRLSDIPHLGIIRLHSRVPVVSPELMDAEKIAALAGAARVWLALHVNHARELTDAARATITRLRQTGIPLVSQTVLLKGVNADGPVLAELFRVLVRLGVKPYYLHHGDMAPGTGHFRTTLAEGMAIRDWLATNLSSLARPLYVIDIPGGFGKVPVNSEHVRLENGEIRLIDHAGMSHLYSD